MKTIKNKLVSIFVAIVIVPIVLLGFLSYSKSKDILENELKINNLNILKEVNKLYLENFLDGIETDVQALTERINTNEIFVNKEYDEIVFKEWELYRNINPYVEYIYVGTRYNQMLTNPVYEIPENYKCIDRPWYITGIKNLGKPAWTKAYNEASSNAARVSATKALKDSNGNDIGVFSMDISLNVLTEVIDKLNLGKNANVFIINNEGTVLTHTNKEKINENLSGEIWIKDILENNEGSNLKNIDNNYYYVCHVTVKNTEWKLVALIPREQLSAKVASIKNITLLIGIICTIISIIIGMLISNRGFTKPIIFLRDASRKLANGNLNLDMNLNYTKRKDEIGDLAKSIEMIGDNFKIIIDQISSNSQNVESSVNKLEITSQQSVVAADEVAKTIQEIANGANEQAKDTEEAVWNINELGLLIEDNKNKLDELNESTNKVIELKEEGIQNIQELVKKTQINKESAQEIKGVIVNVNES
ncbi:MAG: methyl-accepting chemotaxis protein [Tepidibacter sp.]|uniref:methyl-accepting chemotaxis protein n=1 Tax=Tepidibacter sp. TaxID=2529387 RepID=UPI0025F10178|nr:methyl-accepting chemotaxis protein [Tepidibacter sp.]MCT4509379.1 methyl-accepting chemotaxis protein [Tepidibacter sp.]